MSLVPIGKFKVAYWSEGDLVSSKMFNDYRAALTEVQKRQREGYLVMLMESVAVGNGEYVWSVRKKGIGKSFLLLTMLYPYRFAVAGLVLYLAFRR
mgnify:CR=1 FL=1